MQNPAARRGVRMPGVVVHASIAALWIAAFLLARVLEQAPHASLWFPPVAVTFGALLVIGVRALPTIVLACAIATYLAELQYSVAPRPGVVALSSIAFALVHGVAYGVPAMLLRRDERRPASELTLRSVADFMVLAVASSAFAAVAGAFALSATGLITAGPSTELIVAWWIGDLVALLTLGPLVLRWIVRLADAAGGDHRSRFRPFQPDRTPVSRSAVMKLASIAAVTVASLAAARYFEQRGLVMGLLVLPLVLQVWVVHTESRSAALHGIALFGLLTVGAGTLFGMAADVMTLQFAAIGVAANTYVGLAVPALYASHERLREQVTRDRLTRVMTRAYFEDRASHELERARAAGRPVSLVLFDLDRLKAINDTHGHAVGDAVLVELARRCAGTLRAGDLVGRLSGDEFAVFLPDAGSDEADAAIGRMRAALAAAPFAEPAGRVTASFGRAVSAHAQQGLAELMREADAAMYRDKRGDAQDAS